MGDLAVAPHPTMDLEAEAQVLVVSCMVRNVSHRLQCGQVLASATVGPHVSEELLSPEAVGRIMAVYQV